MKTVIIASANPVKIEVAKQAFGAVFPDESFDFIPHTSKSGVPDQPMGEEQTLQGAENRVEYIKQAFPDADYYVGQEGGVTDDNNQMTETACIVIEDRSGSIGIGKTATFIVPPKLADLVRAGTELGFATDEFFGLNNSKHEGGLIGQLTEGQITRTQFYLQATIIALAQIKQKQWFLRSR